MSAETAAVRVLIVDDHAALADALLISLAAEGMEATSAQRFGPEDILALAADFEPDVALVDLYLDHHTAHSLIRPLTEREIPVVILTASQEASELAAALSEGAVAVVRKTQPLADTIAAIRAAAAGEEAMNPQARARLLADAHTARPQAQDKAALFHRLTPRERTVLTALMAGKGTAKIAAEQFVGEATVRSQVQSLLRKLEVNTRLAAVALARQVDWTG